MATAQGKLGTWSGLKGRASELFVRAKNEHSSPPEVGLSVAAGVFAACTPFYGFHSVIALGLGTVLRLNRLWAFLGSRISPLLVYPWISFCEIELAHRLRAGEWLRISAREALAQGKTLWIDWAVGALLVGSVLAAVLGFVAYGFAKRWEKARSPAAAPAGPLTPRTPDALLARSSESPPSAPRGSTP